jgi:hypothetical protein
MLILVIVGVDVQPIYLPFQRPLSLKLSSMCNLLIIPVLEVLISTTSQGNGALRSRLAGSYVCVVDRYMSQLGNLLFLVALRT